jgi:hypothetical protein
MALGGCSRCPNNIRFASVGLAAAAAFFFVASESEASHLDHYWKGLNGKESMH